MGQLSSFPIATGSNIKSTGSTTARSLPDRLAEIINVRDFGALGDGSHDDTANIQAAMDAAYGTAAAPHGTASVTSNKPVFFPNGAYKTTSAITLRSVRGAHIFGAGRFTTKITNTTSNGSIFVTNGFEYSRIEAMHLVSNGTGKCFDLDWDNTGATALQSNTFSDMFFEAGAYGLRIGATGFMGSETSIINCFFANHTTAGIATSNGNALQQSMFGGNIAGCAIGIWVGSGSFPLIHGVGFQGNTTADIKVDNSANDTYSVAACRTESSVMFAKFQNGSSAHLSGCNQTPSTAGGFAFIEASPGPGAGPGVMLIDGCFSKNGIITGNGKLYIRGNPSAAAFENANYLTSFTGTVVQNI